MMYLRPKNQYSCIFHLGITRNNDDQLHRAIKTEPLGLEMYQKVFRVAKICTFQYNKLVLTYYELPDLSFLSPIPAFLGSLRHCTVLIE